MDKETVLNNTILLGVSGSHAYGFATESSDVDKRGVCFGLRKHYLGLDTFEQYIDPDEDTTIYEFKKFLRLCYKNNPNALEILFLPNYQIMTEMGHMLLLLRRLFLSKQIVKSFGGYAYGQLQKIKYKKTDRIHKEACHLMRLIFMCQEVLTNGTLTVDRAVTGDAAYLKEIREGKYDVLELINNAEAMLSGLEDLKAKSKLRETPSYDQIQTICLEMLSTHLTL